jgi:hypothetical protein
VRPGLERGDDAERNGLRRSRAIRFSAVTMPNGTV